MHRPLLVQLALCGALLAACLSVDRDLLSLSQRQLRSGKIEQIKPTLITNSHERGVSAILGGLGTLALGSLLGRGNGNDVAHVSAALVGSGDTLPSRSQPYRPALNAQQVIVRLNNGVLVAIIQPTDSHLHTSMAVYIEGSGLEARVVTYP